MATSSATRETRVDKTTDYLVDSAKQTSSQMINMYRQTATLALGAAETWMATVTQLFPVAKMASTPLQKMAGAWVQVGFDVTQDLVSLQHELATAAMARLTPPTSE